MVRRHAIGKDPGGSACGYEKRIEHDGNGERIRGLQQIVPAEAAVVVRIFEDYAGGLSPITITRRLNAEGVPSPRSGKTRGHPLGKAAAWTPNTLTGNAARGTGILDNLLYVGRRPYGKQTYRKNPDTGKCHAFINPENMRAGVIEAPELRIVPVELWERVKARQATLTRAMRNRARAASAVRALPRKAPTWCGNRLTIRQDELDTRVLAGLATEMLRDDVVAAFVTEYEAETRRLAAETVNTRPEREAELENLDRQIALAKAAILKGVDAAMFVEDVKAWNERRKVLLAEQDDAQTASTESQLLHPDLGRLYRDNVGQLTAAFLDDALKAQAFERLRAIIEAVVLTPEDGDLTIDLRGELASMLELCAEAETQKASAGEPLEVLQIKMVAGTRLTRYLRSNLTALSTAASPSPARFPGLFTANA